MIFDTAFWVALNSCLVLGLVHGVNPCGHSWIVLAPFIAGDTSGKRVAFLTASFFGGTALACLLIGLTLGAFSGWLLPYMGSWMDLLTNGIIVLIGTVLLIKPALLHSHDHNHDHDHSHEHDHALNHEDYQCEKSIHAHADGSRPADHSLHSHPNASRHHNTSGHHDHHSSHNTHRSHHHAEPCHSCACHAPSAGSATATGVKATGLFTFGFFNMIVPCPTAAVMYGYAVQSGSPLTSTLIFGAYAAGTGLSLAVVVWAIFRFTGLLKKMDNHRLEAGVMRVIGLLTMAVGIYGFFSS